MRKRRRGGFCLGPKFQRKYSSLTVSTDLPSNYYTTQCKLSPLAYLLKYFLLRLQGAHVGESSRDFSIFLLLFLLTTPFMKSLCLESYPHSSEFLPRLLHEFLCGPSHLEHIFFYPLK